MADSISCHVVAIPYPGRGHINPMINLCKLIALARPSDFLITVVVTEEWLGFIASDPKPTSIRFATIPNVIPSEVNRGSDFAGFYKSTLTKLEDPVEQLLRRMEVPATVLIYDTYLMWVLNLGKRMNIPVASFFTMSATVFSMSYHYDLLLQNGHVGDNFSEKVEEEIDYLPGIPPIRVLDLLTCFNGKGKEVFPIALQAILMAAKARFLLFVSVYELEAKVLDALKSELLLPVYAIGPSIPYFDVEKDENTSVWKKDENTPDYLEWLNRQPEASVLYISQGSFLSVSNAQLEEIITGVHESGVRYMWIARGETSRFKHKNDEKGIVIPWCEQLRVLCHSSVGAFWSHCGWNSTKEGAYSGVPMLTFPLFWDQVPNSKMIVQDWKMGKRVSDYEGSLVTREEIAKLVKSFMDHESEEGKEMRKRAREVQKICRQATNEGGSAKKDIDSFISDMLNSRNN
ncbi:UDP-glycosyltransferase 87A1-like [Cynara cardunculus var. scolymus]|uniref:UDP-glucuronosyl/UDP-glucosyltransferase n=1 Tax=Cynara cardunculus var. scolymus TaxID=59895 RepID=A0A103Y724_CYNCS|nr:UDP-glycosyltransferase 87A1-like [Cynara cardunculus var. scolymus]KVI03717.1 UDP-glucuronosyl/UDP-glucosyltransferase [Cynara cardunculus var. scolymus]